MKSVTEGFFSFLVLKRTISTMDSVKQGSLITLSKENY